MQNGWIGKLGEGERWRQAGILDTVFEGSVLTGEGGQVTPRVSGSAFVTAEGELILNPDDPFREGIKSVR